MHHVVYGKEELKRFIRQYEYYAYLWETYPSAYDIIEERYYYLLDRMEEKEIYMEYRREIESAREAKWMRILRAAVAAAEELEGFLRFHYGMRDPVIVAEAYPHVVYSWRIKKKIARSGKPVYYARRVEKIIGEKKGAIFILVPREFKPIARRLLVGLREKYYV
jgi:hypothetical protein